MNSLIYALSINSHSTQVKQAPLKILYDLLKDTDCILIGRCGNYVFRDRGDCISIFLHGEFSKRVESMSKKWKITKTEATKRIPKMDEYRALYHKFYTSEVWGMSNYYDLTINTYRLGCEKQPTLLKHIFNKPLFLSIPNQPLRRMCNVTYFKTIWNYYYLIFYRRSIAFHTSSSGTCQYLRYHTFIYLFTESLTTRHTNS